jgi:hypothetical protein
MDVLAPPSDFQYFRTGTIFRALALDSIACYGAVGLDVIDGLTFR